MTHDCLPLRFPPCTRPTHLRLLRWLATLLLVLTTVSFAACAERSAPTSGGASPAAGEPAQMERSVVVTMDMTLEVDDVDRSVEQVRKLVEQRGGYVASGESQGEDGDRRARLEARVPAKSLPDFRADVGSLGKVEAESERTEDVTAPRADLDARLRNARAHEKRLLALLEEKTGSLADVVAIEKEIASVRETVERLEAEERVLEGRIAYATVYVSVQPVHVQLWARPGESILSAFGAGLRAARNLMVGTAVVCAAVLPSLVLIAAALAIVLLLVRGALRWRRRRVAAARS